MMDFANETILLIEDNEQNRYLLTFLLEKHGYIVVAAFDGKTGITMANKIQPAAILLDIQLPDADGYAVARTLRESPTQQDTTIIAVTSTAMSGDREKALAAGCNGYIEKPIDPVTFVSEMEIYMRPKSLVMRDEECPDRRRQRRKPGVPRSFAG
jgi:two-component system, cell cycle response regulator DivK